MKGVVGSDGNKGRSRVDEVATSDWHLHVHLGGLESGEAGCRFGPFGKFHEGLEEKQESHEEENRGEHGPEDHPVVEVVEGRLSVEGGHESAPAGDFDVRGGVDDAAGPGREGGSEGVEVVFDREADIPGEDHTDEHRAEGKAVADQEILLGELATVGFGGFQGEKGHENDSEHGENSRGPDESLKVTPESVEVTGESTDLGGERFSLEGVASGVTFDGDSGSAVEDDSVLLGASTAGLEDSLQGEPSADLSGGGAFAPGVLEGTLVGNEPFVIVHDIGELGVLGVSSDGSAATGLEVFGHKRPGGGGINVAGDGESRGVSAWNGVDELGAGVIEDDIG